MHLQVLGTGCPKCKKLYEAAKAAAERSGKEFTIDKVEDINDIIAMGVMMTPALVVDGEVKASGKVPDAAALEGMLA